MENSNSMANIMNLVKLFAPSSPSSPGSSTGQPSWPMFPIDAHIHTEPLRVCKCLIPYLPFKKQRDLSILIKVFELVSVADYFADLNESDPSFTNLSRSDNWQSDLLHSVKNNLDPKNAYLADIFFKINDVKKILSTAQTITPPTERPLETSDTSTKTSPNFLETIAPSLDDNQRKILETLSMFMK